MSMVRVKQLIKNYNDIPALNLSPLTISPGESFGLVGNNGAGKTTFFSLVLDLIRPSQGSVEVRDQTVQASEHWKMYTGSYLDEGFLIGYLRPEEYFEFTAGLYGLNKDQCDRELERFEEFFNGEVLGRKKLIRDLSKGNRKKVGIAAAMLINPELLILDEPFPNLDPTSVIRLKHLLKLEKQKNTTMLISSHSLNHVTEVCDRIVVLEMGQIVKDLRTSTHTLKELEDYFNPVKNYKDQ
jgi:ABC-2 type transport system ATP-binding protein